ncbi:MAG: LPXTG cell wall anchor domain-containing protein, partial [Candidatus Faecivicinus sp.]
NQSGTELPSTGGMGTTVLYIAGGALVLLAMVVLVMKKRMNASK